jgi:hypothetical protein
MTRIGSDGDEKRWPRFARGKKLECVWNIRTAQINTTSSCTPRMSRTEHVLEAPLSFLLKANKVQCSYVPAEPD